MIARFLAFLFLALTLAVASPAAPQGRVKLLHVSGLPSTLTVNFGDQTPARYGGYRVPVNGVGVTWSIVSQTTSGAFCPLDGTLVWCGASYGGARTVTTPTVGNDTYEVTVQSSLGDTSLIKINVIAHRYDIAPTTDSVGDTSANFQMGVLAIRPLFCGDNLVGRPGNYNVGNGGGGTSKSFLLLVTTTRQARGGGPACPTNPHVHGVAEDSTNDGWVSVTCEVPLACILGGTSFTWTYDRLPTDAVSGLTTCPTGGCFYMSFRGWVYTVGTLTHVANSGNHVEAWTEYGDFESTTPISTAYTTGGNHDWFVHDGYLHDMNATAVAIYAVDCQIIGNTFDRINYDVIHEACYNSVFGSHRSQVSWNYARNKISPSSADNHTDFDQTVLTVQTAPKIWGKAVTVEGAQVIGNVFVRGQGSPPGVPPGTAWPDGQCIFKRDVTSPNFLTSTIRGNICISVFSNGITLQDAGPGTVVANNSIIQDYAVTLGPNQGPPRLRVQGSGSSAITAFDNLFSGPTNVVSGPAPVETNSVENVSGATMATLITTAAPGTNVQTIAAVIAAFTPKAGGGLLPPGQDTIGAINPCIDFVNRVFSCSP